MSRKVVGVVALVLALTTGCSSGADSGVRAAAEPSKATYPPSQAWALADGMVTDAEYRSATTKFTACIKKAGLRVTTPQISPIDGITLLYDIAETGDPDKWSKNVEACSETEVSQIESEYLAGHRQLMDPRLRIAVTACLSAKGFPLKGLEQNVADFVQATKITDGQPVNECVSRTFPKVFPDAPEVIKIRW
jgi:hypothetical protein